MSQPLDLGEVVRSMPGLSAAKARSLVEAARVCLDSQEHDSGAALEVDGDIEESYALLWKKSSAVLRRTYADEQEATEEGAVAVAVAVMVDATKYQVVERAVKGDGIDYWLGREAGLFEARLEVSGIRTGEGRDVQARIKQKLKQMHPSDKTGLPGYAVVVEFGTPRARVRRK